MMAGQYKSVFRGSGIEFEEVREYTPGDDVKSIDWKVSARLGRPFVKLYREERELIVMLLIDMSASGYFGTSGSLKQEIAAEVAAVLAFNAIRNNDKVGAILFTDRVEKYIPPMKGSSHVWRVIKELFAFEPQHKGTNIQDAIGYLGRVSRKRTVAFLISDFLSRDYSHQLKIAGKRHELIGVPVPNPQGGFKKDSSGRIVMTRLDEEPLKKMAVFTGGTYVRSVAGDMDLDVIYNREIRGKMDTATLSSGRKQIGEDRYQWFLILALTALIVELFLPSTTKKVLALVLLLVLVFGRSPALAAAGVYRNMQKGLEAYQNQNYEDALKFFIDAQLENPDRSEIYYNIGNT
uniref:DUF58 domain-containing protein n=1 Tax=Candidatus Desulfatibia profunda TaxID=2841695 RepID=A0A8J6NPK1_9BACT|nr:DUF58 domain-containing protein [Candidatus Desulfatibia profunda]